MTDDAIGAGFESEIRVIDSEAQGASDHWSSLPGSLPLVRSLLAREVAAAGNSEMSEWFMAVIEDVENEVAQTRDAMVLFDTDDAHEMLMALATRMYIDARRGLEA